jgi:CRP-like cAMP-binding protein
MKVRLTSPFEHFCSFVQKIIPTLFKDDLEGFFSKAKKAEFKKGEHLVEEGDVCRRLFFIHRGLFRYYILHEGHDITKDFVLISIILFAPPIRVSCVKSLLKSG